MSILVDERSVVLVQGITGRVGAWHTRLMIEYGVRVVAGVTPGKGGEVVSGVPVYDTIQEALEMQPVNVSIVFVPPAGVKEAVCESIDASIPLIVIVTEHVPVMDALSIAALAKKRNSTILGPNSVGVISPGKCKVGIMPGFFYGPGAVGIISRSGTLTHEIALLLTERHIGQSTCVGIGGDTVIGTDYVDLLGKFDDDDETKCIIMIGEIGGWLEQRAAEYVAATGFSKPIFSFLAGRKAPQGQRMGHAGALVSGTETGVEAKEEKMLQAGIRVFKTPESLSKSVAEFLRSQEISAERNQSRYAQ